MLHNVTILRYYSLSTSFNHGEHDGKIMRRSRSELGVARGHSSVTVLVVAENTMKVMRRIWSDLALVVSKVELGRARTDNETTVRLAYVGTPPSIQGSDRSVVIFSPMVKFTLPSFTGMQRETVIRHSIILFCSPHTLTPTVHYCSRCLTVSLSAPLLVSLCQLPTR